MGIIMPIRMPKKTSFGVWPQEIFSFSFILSFLESFKRVFPCSPTLLLIPKESLIIIKEKRAEAMKRFEIPSEKNKERVRAVTVQEWALIGPPVRKRLWYHGFEGLSKALRPWLIMKERAVAMRTLFCSIEYIVGSMEFIARMEFKKVSQGKSF